MAAIGGLPERGRHVLCAALLSTMDAEPGELPEIRRDVP
jgi:hypothetical protein